VSGSTKVGKRVQIGGQAGIAGHLTVGDGVKIAARCGVAQSIEDGRVVSGFPAMPHRLWLRTRSLIRRLPELFKRVKDLEKRLDDEASGE
jgi:UDP-3-O-[3-hydroxymyristoyl] glucosamine N-acyltransferase